MDGVRIHFINYFGFNHNIYHKGKFKNVINFKAYLGHKLLIV